MITLIAMIIQLNPILMSGDHLNLAKIWGLHFFNFELINVKIGIESTTVKIFSFHVKKSTALKTRPCIKILKLTEDDGEPSSPPPLHTHTHSFPHSLKSGWSWAERGFGQPYLRRRWSNSQWGNGFHRAHPPPEKPGIDWVHFCRTEQFQFECQDRKLFWKPSIVDVGIGRQNMSTFEVGW